jgi:hypothetical protein
LERHSASDLRFGGPALYRIVVQGNVSEHLADRLGQMVITATARVDQREQTTLTGPIQDQAELFGLLDTLHGLHIPIIRVEVVSDRDPSPNQDKER